MASSQISHVGLASTALLSFSSHNQGLKTFPRVPVSAEPNGQLRDVFLV